MEYEVLLEIWSLDGRSKFIPKYMDRGICKTFNVNELPNKISSNTKT